MKDQEDVSRRDFIKRTTLGTVAAVGISGLVSEKPLTVQLSSGSLNREDVR